MINFTQLKYKNILSTGNSWTTIELNKAQSTLIVGTNGAGKSTMLDAICFALYGKPFRKINKPQLVNSINRGNLEVHVEFNVGRRHYKIIRGIKPTIFEIWQDGKMINQDASARDYQSYLEEHVLKMNYKSFGQIVVLGSSTFVPFMQLTPNHRRAVIEDLLDQQVFTNMNSLLKEDIDDNKVAVSEATHQRDLLESKIELSKKHKQNIRSMKEDAVQDIKSEMSKQIELVETLDAANRKLDEKIDYIGFNPEEITRLKRAMASEKEVSRKVLADKSRIEKEKAFFHDNDTCPTCTQGIDSDFKSGKIHKCDEEIARLYKIFTEAEDNLEQMNERAANLKLVSDKIAEFEDEKKANLLRKRTAMDTLRGLKKRLEQAQTSVDDVDDTDIAQMREDHSKLVLRLTDLVSEREMLGVAAIMLKDSGIKAKIIRQYIPVINTLINKYLAEMDFFVQFELDESFSETIKSRHRDVFSYSSFSEGEKLRIDLCLMLTWRAVSRLRSSVSTNLLVLDEVFDGSLDTDGIDALTNILTNSDDKSNIFVISHKGDKIHDKFDRVLTTRKHKNFSVISED